MKKKLLTLAKDHEFSTEEEYFNYIIDSYINGQRQQVRELFNDMRKEDKEDFLFNYLNSGGKETNEAIKKICIEELLK